MKQCVVIILLALFLCRISTWAAQDASEFANHTQDELFEKANYFLETRHRPDSALLFLTAMLSRGELENFSDGDLDRYAIGYMARGSIYASVYGNYSEAVVNLLKGRDLARDADDKSLQTGLDYNLYAIKYEQGCLSGEKTAADSLLVSFKKIIGDMGSRINPHLTLALAQSAVEIGIRNERLGEVKELLALIPDLPDTLP